MKGGTVRKRAGAVGLLAVAAGAAAVAGDRGAAPLTDGGPFLAAAPPAPTAAPAQRPADLGASALGPLAAETEAPAPPPDERAPARASLNLFGVTGLIDTPTAEMQPDGQLSLSGGYIAGQLRSTLTFQILPWVEGSFRYSALSSFQEGGVDLFDRSFDVKVRLIEEGPDYPAVAFGLQDFLGTGVFSGEYFVASKRVLPELTISGGLGWGRFASGGSVDNPITFFKDGFKTREGSSGQLGETGQVRFGRFFRGENLGFFGGVEWRTPIEGLSLKAEYSEDDYALDGLHTGYDAQIPFNFGIEYRPWDGVEIGAYATHGTDFGLRATFTGNPSEPIAALDSRPGPPPILPRQRPEPPQIAVRFGPVREALGPAPAAPGDTPAAAAAALDGALAGATHGPRWA